MQEFTILISEIFFISCISIVLEIFIDPDRRPYQAKIASLACFAGSMYLVLEFLFNTLFKELTTVFQFSLFLHL